MYRKNSTGDFHRAFEPGLFDTGTINDAPIFEDDGGNNTFPDAMVSPTGMNVASAVEMAMPTVAEMPVVPAARTAMVPVARTAIGPVTGMTMEPVSGTGITPIPSMTVGPVYGTGVAPLTKMTMVPVVGLGMEPTSGEAMAPIAGTAMGPPVATAVAPEAEETALNAATAKDSEVRRPETMEEFFSTAKETMAYQKEELDVMVTSFGHASKMQKNLTQKLEAIKNISKTLKSGAEISIPNLRSFSQKVFMLIETLRLFRELYLEDGHPLVIALDEINRQLRGLAEKSAIAEADLVFIYERLVASEEAE